MNLELVIHNLINKDNENVQFKKSSDYQGKTIFISNNDDLKNVLNIEKIEHFQEVINFLKINPFIFNIDKVYKIEFVPSSDMVLFCFDGVFSSKTILQYHLKTNKFRVIVHAYISILDVKELTNSKFNLMCHKITENVMVHKNFKVKNPEVQLNKLKDFMYENEIPFSELTSGHLSLMKIVEY